MKDNFTKISDLGISKSSMDHDNDEIYGIAPEILCWKEYTVASDIYSFSMIMWELLTGRKPFWDQDNDIELIIKICKDFRPPIIKNTPIGYNQLMQKCWDSDSNTRPTTFDIHETLINIMRVEEEYPTKIIKSSNVGPIITNNSNKSRPLSGIMKSAKSMISSEGQQSSK